MNPRLSPEVGDTSLAPTRNPESPLANFGPKLHTFDDQDRAKAVAARRQKAAERRGAAMSVPEYLRTRLDEHPERFARPYLEAFDKGEAALIKDAMDRAYGRPAQTVTITQGIDTSQLEDGDRVELCRLVLEQLRVTTAAAEHGEIDARGDGPHGAS